MKKINKIIMLIIIFALIICMTTTVFADNQLDLGTITGNETSNTDDDDDIPNLSDSLTGGNTNTPSNDEKKDETIDNNGENSTTDDTIQDLTPSIPNKDNTSSTYQESNIPHAGVESSTLMVMLFIACVITGIYTYVKLSDYSNI